jgi:putative redox protein
MDDHFCSDQSKEAVFMPEKTHAETEVPSSYPQVIQIRKHTFRTDVSESLGSTDSAPGAHDYFDAALAACKTLTVTWYARKNQIPLERVVVDIERDDAEERKGKYVLKVRLAFHGPLSDEQRTRLLAVAERCPVKQTLAKEIRVETVDA